ncbi:MAG: helix-turn-helix domain-containing protein [Deltaproteobacteria bacterium]|nr:helix-turn-helix domain-containing protein [Deltaproteobacteria bacterium]
MKERNYDLDQLYLTQQEVADRFRVKPGTIKNWRERGLLPYLQAPGSTRVIYPKEAVEEFERQSTKTSKAIEKIKPAERKRETPGMSSRPQQEWRI